MRLKIINARRVGIGIGQREGTQMTNLEKIKEMDAGDMAIFLNRISLCIGSVRGCDDCPLLEAADSDGDGDCHIFSIKNWLESEAKNR